MSAVSETAKPVARPISRRLGSGILDVHQHLPDIFRVPPHATP